ncbi:MAG: hypothetical protein ACHREM_16265 [Polyangiales bacterium]
MPQPPPNVDDLVKAIKATHGVDAKWLEGVPVQETFDGAVAWAGVVEIFEVAHPKASRVYAWSYRPDDTTTRMRTVAVLGAGPVVDAQTAVRAMLIAQAKKNEN